MFLIFSVHRQITNTKKQQKGRTEHKKCCLLGGVRDENAKQPHRRGFAEIGVGAVGHGKW